MMLTASLLSGCSAAGAVEAAPPVSTTIEVTYRAAPNITPTTLPPVSAFFIEQPDGSLVATLSDVSLEDGVLFEYNSAVLMPAAIELLEGLLSEVLAHDGPIAVHGWTDGVGSEESNLVLSEDRATSVVNFLRAAGVTTDIDIVGRGEEGSEDGVLDPSRRRVDIVLLAAP